jgi:hypothetical protein
MASRAVPTSAAAASGVSWRAVALPVEHGGWGLLGEPILMGLCLAPSRAGLGIALTALAAFLARHPLKLVLTDRRRGARYPRTALGERFVLGYGLLALLGLVAAADASPLAWVVLALGVPFGLAQLAYDVKLQGRALAPELLGALALGSVAAAILLAGRFSVGAALAAWTLLALKAVASVFYVRVRLRLDRGLRPGLAPPLAAHGLAVTVAGLLASVGHAPWLSVFAFVVLSIRAAFGLSPLRRIVRPRVVGFQELGFGLAFTCLLTLGYALGW